MTHVHSINEESDAARQVGTEISPEVLRISSLGTELSPEESRILAGIMEPRHLHDGEKLIDASERAHTLFLLVDGKLAVTSPGNNGIDGAEKILYIMKPGECAGRRAFVDRTPRQATLRAVGDATVYTLEPDAFESLLGQHPVIVYKCMRALFRTTHTNLVRMNMESEQLSNYIIRSRGRY